MRLFVSRHKLVSFFSLSGLREHPQRFPLSLWERVRVRAFSVLKTPRSNQKPSP